MIALGLPLPNDHHVHRLVSGEVDELIRERAACGSADAIERVRRGVLALLGEASRTAPVDLMVLDELGRRADLLRRPKVH